MARPPKMKQADVVAELFEEDAKIDLPERPEDATILPAALRGRAAQPTPRPRPAGATTRPRKNISTEQLRGLNEHATVDRATEPETFIVNQDPAPVPAPQPDPAEAHAAAELNRFVAGLDAARGRLREGVEQSLNNYLRTQSPKDLQSKNRIAGLVAGLLGRLGLAVEHDGKPCSFYTLSGTKDRNGRFRLVPHGTNQYVALSAKLEDFLPLKLIDFTPPIDLAAEAEHAITSSGRWRNRIVKQPGTVGRQ